MFDFWEALKYVIKEKISQFKLGVHRFFCKHHYVEEKYFGMECLEFIVTALNVLNVARLLKKKIG